MVDNATEAEAGRREAISPRSGWQFVWGILLIIAGALAALMPVAAAFANALVLAWLLVFGGGFEIAHAIQTRHDKGFGWKVASGILTLAAGILILIAPAAGVVALALIVGAVLLVGGVARTVLAVQLRPARGWGWVLLDGLASLALGALIVIGWPESSFAIIGLLTGLWLMTAGIWRIAIARAYEPA